MRLIAETMPKFKVNDIIYNNKHIFQNRKKLFKIIDVRDSELDGGIYLYINLPINIYNYTFSSSINTIDSNNDIRIYDINCRKEK